MNRTRILKITIPLLYAAILTGCFALMTVGDGGWGLLAFVLLLAAITLTFAAIRDFITGRILLLQGEAAKAVTHLEAFLAKVRASRALRHGIWLIWPVHTISLEAMALNNLGAAAMALGDLERSETLLRQALRADPRYSVPCYNLALLAAHRGDEDEAEQLRAEALRLGFSASRMDGSLQNPEAAHAAEGRGGTGEP